MSTKLLQGNPTKRGGQGVTKGWIAERNGRAASRRILLIHSDGNLPNNPSLKAIVDLLRQRGCDVDIRLPLSSAPLAELDGVRLLPYGRLTKRLRRLVFNKLCSRWPVFMLVFVERLFVYSSYDLIIGVDRRGLVEGSVLSKLTRAPLLFVSFEIMFESETSRRYKALERWAASRVTRWLVQDETRATKLHDENGLPLSRATLLPLASAGLGTFPRERIRDRLAIPPDKKVAIIIGSMSSWTMTSEILNTLPEWPRDWVLIVHDRYGRTSDALRERMGHYRPMLGKRLYVSDMASATVDNVGSILAGVSVGLAFYSPDGRNPFTGRNLRYLGLASGKISTYLRYGVPVIVNEIGVYAREAREFGFGCVVRGPEQIPRKLKEASQDSFRESAKEYFQRKLDFNNYREKIWRSFLGFSD